MNKRETEIQLSVLIERAQLDFGISDGMLARLIGTRAGAIAAFRKKRCDPQDAPFVMDYAARLRRLVKLGAEVHDFLYMGQAPTVRFISWWTSIRRDARG